MLYQGNTFVLPTRNFTARVFETSLNTGARRAWVKSLEVTLDRADMTEEDGEFGLEDITSTHRDNIPYSAPEELWTVDFALHEINKDHLGRKTWPRKLKPVLDFLLLDKIVLDLHDSHRSRSFCKVADHNTRDAFFRGFAIGMPKMMEIRHADNREEYKPFIARRTAKRQLMLGGMNCEA